MSSNDTGPIDADSVATPDQPKVTSRIQSLDLIRGFAVMGIVIANMAGFAALSAEHSWPAVDGPLSAGEKAVWLIQYIFVDGKLRGLFSLLFGAGMVIFLDRAKARGGSATWIQIRRLFWLFVFGLGHYYLLYTGDILHNYAIAGLIALLFLRVPPKLLFGLAAIIFVAYTYFPYTGLTSYRGFEEAAMNAPKGAEIRQAYDAETAEELQRTQSTGRIMANGSLPEIVNHRIETRTTALIDHPERWLAEYTLLMLMGGALLKLGFFSGNLDRRKMIGLGLAGITISAAGSLYFGLWSMREGFPRVLNLFVFYGPVYAIRLPMILGYAAILVALSSWILQSILGERIAAAGRMAFSNYIGTSLVMAVIFQGWGFGLFNQFDKVERLGFILLAWVLMLAWSKPWLARFKFGPLEWAWRCLTYWRLFPIRRNLAA